MTRREQFAMAAMQSYLLQPYVQTANERKIAQFAFVMADAMEQEAVDEGGAPSENDQEHRIQLFHEQEIARLRGMIEYALQAPKWEDCLSVLHDALAGKSGP